MKRRWFAVIGSVVVLFAGYATSRWALTPRLAVAAGLVGAAGVLILLGGYDPLPRRLPWNRLVGAGVVLVGAVFLIAWVVPVLQGDRSTAAIVLAGAGLVNATILGLAGLDWFLGGVFFDLSSVEPGPLFGGAGDDA